MLNSLGTKAGGAASDYMGGKIAEHVMGQDPDAYAGLSPQDIPKYDKFLSCILQDAEMAVTVPQYWVVFFTLPPGPPVMGPTQPTEPKSFGAKVSSGWDTVQKKASSPLKSISEGWTSLSKRVGDELDNFGKGVDSHKDTDSDDFNYDTSKWKLGVKSENMASQLNDNIEKSLMLVQAIEIPGDGFSVERPQNQSVGGYLSPAITGPRTELPIMTVAFLENNSSLTDLVLRPWVVESSYKSLKFATKRTITCYNLTRSPSGFRIRKKFQFYNAVAISVDSEGYTYESGGSYGKRQVEFVYTHYDLDEGDMMKDHLVNQLANWALQKTRKFVSGVVESGVEAVAGGANQVLTNVKGAFVDSVTDHLSDTQSRMRDSVERAEGSIIDGSQQAIDKAIGFNPDGDSLDRGGGDFSTEGADDNPSPRIPILSDPDDALVSPPAPPRSSGVINNATYTIVKIDKNDTVDTNALSLQHVDINSSDTSSEVEVNSIDSNKDDTPDTKSLNVSEVVINDDDVFEDITATPVNISKDDESDGKGLDTTHVAISTDDESDGKGITTTHVDVSKDDEGDGKGLDTTHVAISTDDESDGKGLNTTHVNASSDDESDGKGLNMQSVEVNSNDGV